METIEPYPNPDGLRSYQLNQTFKQNMFQTENDEPLSVQAKKNQAFNDPSFRNSVGCTASYPSTFVGGLDEYASNPYSEIMNSEYKNKKNDTIKAIPQFGFKGESDIQNVPKLVQEGFGNVSGGLVNDPTNDLLDVNSRPITDYVHNNMVPFYGGSVKQNMAGTGVKSGNYIDGVNVNSGFDNTTPYANKLDLFTGMDDTYLHKREIGPKYSPAEQQSGWVYGMPAFRPDEDRYTQSMFMRNDLAPCEQEMVGPGMDIGADIPASGGFHDLTRVMPNNVSNYKANQLQGRVKAGKMQLGGEEPTALPGVGLGGSLSGGGDAPGVSKNRPDKFYSQIRRPTMTTKVGIVQDQELLRPDYNVSFKPGNAKRAQTNYGFGTLIVDGTNPKNQNMYNAVPLSAYGQ